MIVYDFDKTILSKDASVEFCKFILKKKPYFAILYLKSCILFIMYLLHKVTYSSIKECIFSFLKSISDYELNSYLDEFWDKNIQYVFPYYLKQKKETDVVISASPEFLLRPALDRLNVKTLLATPMDIHTGKIVGNNCHDVEKVRRYREVFGDTVIDEFYSDSFSDNPLAEISKKPFRVLNDGTLTDWKF